MNKRSLSALASTALALGLAAAAVGTDGGPPAQREWVSGMFGTFDRAAAQRGFQVYEEVVPRLPRPKVHRLPQPRGSGLHSDQIVQIAAKFEVTGRSQRRRRDVPAPAKPADRMPSPFANEQAARVANNGAYPPDLSLIVDARVGGADYIYGVLTGYRDPPPEGFSQSRDVLQRVLPRPSNRHAAAID